MNQKWHINKKGEVHPCRATKIKCQFGGDSGLENHYASREDAVKAQVSEDAGFSTLGTSTRKKVSESFKKNRDSLRKSLVAYGVARANELEDVTTQRELVEKWFSGDSSKYERFVELEANSSLRPEAKKSIAQLISKGVAVSSVNATDEFDSEATVDILDESLKGLSLSELRTSRPF